MESNILVKVGADISNFSKGINSAIRELRDMKRQFSAMKNAFKLEDAKAMLPFRRQLFEVEKDMYSLSRSMGNFKGTNAEFMKQVDDLGKRYKKANDNMINANKSLGMSMIQTAGYMMNMTTQAKRIADGYKSMNNPLLKVNKSGLIVANALNRIANSGNAAVLALKRLGPNASMKALIDEQAKINQGLMRFQAVALAASVTSAIFYGSLHKAAMKANKEYATAFKNMSANLKKAFEPMRQVFAQVMIPVFNFINALAKMTIAFNKAHPKMAKVLQGILLLIPALTLLLSPLAIGIGLISGMVAAFGSLWVFIGPLITGLAAMSGTVWIVAAAVAVLAAAATGVIKKWEPVSSFFENLWARVTKAFQSAMPVIDSVKNKLSSLLPSFDTIKNKVVTFATTLGSSVSNAFSSFGETVKGALSGNMDDITSIFKMLIPTIIGIIVGGFPGLLISLTKFMPAIADFLNENLPTILTAITNAFTQLSSLISTYAPTIIQALVSGINTALPAILTAAVTIITSLINGITSALPVILNAGVQLFTMLINGIISMLPTIINVVTQLITVLTNALISMLPQIINAGITLITALINGLISALPTIINAGIQILLALINGIISVLPTLIDAAITLIFALVDALIANLPTIINAGIQILNALINGIIKILPKLVDAGIKLITALVNALIKNLPKIIDAGVKLLTALINGITKVLPKLITAAIKLITALADALIKNLPKILAAGGQILLAIIKGVLKLIPQLLKLGGTLVVDLAKAVIKAVPQLVKAGADLIRGLWNGIKSVKKWILSKISGFVDGIVGGIKKFFGIHSPSRVMAKEVGRWIPAGLIVGIDKMRSQVADAAQRMVQAAIPDMPRVSLAYATPTGVYSALGSAVNGTVTVESRDDRLINAIHKLESKLTNLTVEMDGRQVGRIVEPYVSEKQARDIQIRKYFRGWY